MRDDMRDVLITRARGGAGWKKPGRKRPLEDLPSFEPIDRRGTKFFTDLLGPLKRFLRSRVGRSWDEVWSELCRALDRRSLLQQHVFFHLERMVEHESTPPLFRGAEFRVDPATGRLERPWRD